MKTFALALAVLIAAPAFATPPSKGVDAFGIVMGQSVRKLDGAKPFKPGWYNVANPPEPDPRFAKVAVEAFGDTGVCVVQAIGPEITGDPSGAKVRQAIDRLADDFSAVYGQPEKLDECKGFGCAPDLWGEDLRTGDRHYGYRWRLLGGDKTKGVREVSVVAVAHSVSSSVFLVQFDSADLSKCRTAELRQPDLP